MRTKRMVVVPWLIVSAAAAVAGCARDEAETVLGTERARLEVTVARSLAPETSRDPAASGQRLVVIWSTYGQAACGSAACFELSPANVTADGAGYRLEIETPPSENILAGAGILLSDPSSVRVVPGLVAVVDGGDLGSVDIGAIRGISSDHIVLFAEGDVAEGTFVSALVNAPLGRGFHLVEVSFPAYDADALVADMSDPDPGWECFEPQGACWGGLHMEPAPGGFATPVHVTPVDFAVPFEAQTPEQRRAIAVGFLPFL